MPRAILAILVLFALSGVESAAFFSSAPGPSTRPTSQPSAPDRLRVVSYNIFQGNRGIERIARFLRKQQPDVVFLQEVCRPACDRRGIDQAAYFARSLGDMHLVSATTLGAPNRATHDPVILSRFALRDARLIRGKDGGRVFGVLATLDTSGRPLHLLSVHATSTHKLSLEHALNSANIRMTQITDLLALVRALDGDVIIAGDFNAADWMPEYHAMTRQWTDFGLVADTPRLSFPSHQPRLRIDYVFGRGAFEAVSYRVLDSLASDHRPVVAELQRQKTGQP